MSNPRKSQGTRYESSLRDYAKLRGHTAFRPAQAGAGDLSDVHIDGLLAVQAKDHAAHRFSEWLTDVEQQRVNAGLPFGVVVAKKRRASIGESYAVMTYDTLLALARRLRVAEDLLSVSTAAAPYRQFLEDEVSR